MSKLTVRHWSVQSDPTGPDMDFHTMSERYNHLRPGRIISPEVETMPFYSRPFSIAVWSSQITYGGHINQNLYPSEAVDVLERVRDIQEQRTRIEDAYKKLTTGLDPGKDDDRKKLSDLLVQRDAEIKSLRPSQDYTEDPFLPGTAKKTGQGQFTYNEVKLQYTIDFHIPPSSINWQYQHSLTKNKTRGGWQVERSPENLVTLEVEGSSGIFYHGDHGATRLHAKSTYGHRELMDLVQVYRNNGMSYDPMSGAIYTIGQVLLYYDKMTYVGSFDSFDLKESESSPFKFDYSFTFVSRGELGSSGFLGHVNTKGSDMQNIRAMSLILPDKRGYAMSKPEAIAVDAKKDTSTQPISNTSEGTVETVTYPASSISPTNQLPRSDLIDPFNPGGSFITEDRVL